MRFFVSLLLLLGSQVALADPSAQKQASALILQGMSVDWHARPHRLRVLGAGFSASGSGAEPKGTMWAEVQGGSWASGQHAADVPTVQTAYAGFASTRRPVLVGSTSLRVLGTVRLAGKKRVPATAIADVALPLDVPADTAAVWLSGFRIATLADHPDGFTVHALSVEVGPPSVDHGMLRFPVSALVEAAPVPDRGQKLDTYGADVQVDWVAVPAAASEIHEIDTRARLAKGLAAAADVERVPIAHRPLEWTGFPGKQAVAGISGFHLDLEEDGAMDGRYIRGITVGIGDVRIDPVRHVWTALAALRFSNAGPVTRPIHADVAVSAVVLALRGGETAWAGRWTPSLRGSTRVVSPY